MNKIETKLLGEAILGEIWRASVWIMREHYTALGLTKEKAIDALKDHLNGIIPIYENDIQVKTDLINQIKELLK